MSIKINTDNGTAENFTVVLSSRNHVHYGEIINISNMKYTANLNAADELYFTVNKYADGKKEHLWDEIFDFRFVWVKEIDEYFEINVQLTEDDSNKKCVTAKSACECELSQKMLYNIEINTETDISRDDYVPTQFYNPDNPNASLLHRILEIVPSYSISSIDSSLIGIQRTFSINDKSIYDFLIDDCSNEFHCIFLFDSVHRSISVKDLYTVCNDCGNRGDFSDVCPKCGSHNLKYFGEDTTILVSTQNLTDEVQLEVNTDNVKNVFKLEAGDDIMTAAVMSYIPNGSDRIFNISKEQQKDMSEELVDKIFSYNQLYDSYTEEYQKIMVDIYECIERETYYTSKQMPDIIIEDTTAATAATEAAKLTQEVLNPLALSTLSESTSLATVNSALVNYAKVFVKSGIVKVEVDTGSTFSYSGKTGDINYGTWNGRFKVTRYANKKDVAYSDNITLEVNDNYSIFINEKVMKNIASNDTDDYSIYGVLTKDLDGFKSDIKSYCYERLKSFRDALNSVLSILEESGLGDSKSELYSSFYEPYWNKVQACDAEIAVRESTINEWKAKESAPQERKLEIQNILNFKSYLGEKSYNEFTNYARECKYNNSNYISDGLTDDEIFSRAQEFIGIAKRELVTSSYYQHNLRSNMYNLLLMEEFKPIIDKFELGNWIRIQIDDDIYRLRLVSYEIDFDNLNNINTDFSDATVTANGVNDVYSILKQASAMGSTYSYYSNQASNGQSANNQLRNFVEEGLQSSLINIKNNDNEEVILDNTGLLARSYDDVSDSYSPEQARITHNIFCYTKDNWLTTSLALGKHDYYKYVNGVLTKDTDFGLSATFVTAGYIYGSQIIGGEIYSQNYSLTSGTYINLNNGDFSFAGGKLVYNSSLNKMSLKGVVIEWDSSTTPEITDINGLEEQLSGIQDDLNQLDGRIQTYSQNSDPSLEWTTTADKQNHIGDLWYNPDTSITQRWNGDTWKKTTDSDLAILAQSKAQIFTTTPTTPYYVGDLWVQGSSGDILNCITTRTNGSYNASDWAKSSKYTDDTAANNIDTKIISILAGTYKTTIGEDYVISPHIAGGDININNRFKVDSQGNVTLPDNATISWSNVTNQPTILTEANVTTITENTVTTEYVNALEVTAKSVAAENITGTTITGKRFIGDNIGINSYKNDGWAFYAGDELEGAVEPYTNQRKLNIGHGGEIYGNNASFKEISLIDRCAKNNAYLNFIYTHGSSEKIYMGTIYQDASALRINSEYNIELNATSGSGNNISLYGDITLGGSVNAMYSIAHKQSADFYFQYTLLGALFADINGMSIESRNGGNLSLNSASGVIKYYGTLEENSSKRYKTNITDISDEYVDNILNLSAKRYNYISTGKESFGFIAEDVIEIMPEIVGVDSKNRPDSIAYVKLIPLMIQKIQNLNKRIEELEKR